MIPKAIFDNPHNVSIAQWGSNSIANMASMSELAQNALFEANACDAVIGSMTRHRTHEWTIVHTTRAVRSLCYKNARNKLKFSESDIFTLLLSGKLRYLSFKLLFLSMIPFETALKTHAAVSTIVENACWGIGCIELPKKCEIFK